MIKRIISKVIGGNYKDEFIKSSYSQSGEDLIIDHLFQELEIEKPSFIDIGAHHPRYINNTFLFYKKGSRGINIEPDPELISRFQSMRSDDVNLNIGIGESEGEADFYIMNEPALNTFLKEEAERTMKENSNYKIQEIKQIQISSISSVIQKYCNGKFPELLSIDVEGLDEIILKSINYGGVAPTVMCVETLSFSTKGRGRKNVELIDFLKHKGYMVYADTFINTIFVKEDIYLR